MGETKWQIRDNEGRVWEPMTESVVLDRIRKGEVTGNETIRLFPNGDWESLSKNNSFFDALLELLQRPTPKPENTPNPKFASAQKNGGTSDSFGQNTSFETEKRLLEDTVIRPASDRFKKDKDSVESAAENSAEKAGEIAVEKGLGLKVSPNPSGGPSVGALISSVPSKMVPLGKAPGVQTPTAIGQDSAPHEPFSKISPHPPQESESDDSLSSSPMAMLIVSLGVVFLFGAVYFDLGGLRDLLGLSSGDIHEHSGQFVKILAPTAKKTEPWSKDLVAKTFQKASAEYFDNTAESHEAAQSELINLLEANPEHLEARKLLCLIHHELWPYSAQSPADEQARTLLTRRTRSLDLIGTPGIICETLNFLAKHQEKEALGIVDYALGGQAGGPTDTFLVFAKSEVLYALRNTKDAESYFKSLLSDQAFNEKTIWMRPMLRLVEIFMASHKALLALEQLNAILAVYPSHKESLLWLGVLQFEEFRQSEIALQTLGRALALKGRAPNKLLARAHLALAMSNKAQGNRSYARDEAERAFKLNPNLGEAKALLEELGATPKELIGRSSARELLALGDLYFQQGNFLSAQAEFKAVYNTDPHQALAAIKAAKCLWALHQPIEAIDWTRKAVAADPKYTSAYLLEAEYLGLRYDFVGAAEVLKKAAKKGPMNFELYRGYGVLELQRNDLRKAIQYLTKAYSLYPNDTETLILLARSHIRLRDPKESQLAERYINEALSLDPTNLKAHQEYIRIKASLMGINSALLYVRKISEQYPESSEIREAQVEVLIRDEQCLPAIPILQGLLSESKKASRKPDPNWLIELGDCLKATGKSNEALQSYLEAVVIAPSNAEPLVRAGLLYFDLEKFDQSIAQFRRAGLANKLYPRVNLLLAKALFGKGQTEEALSALAQERKINPGLTDTYLLEGVIYAKNKEWKRCADSLQEAVKRFPYGADIYVRLAKCYRQAENVEVAEQMLFVAQKKESGYAEIYRELGQVLEVKGENQAAVESYNKYLGLSPNAPDRAQVESRIQKISGK